MRSPTRFPQRRRFARPPVARLDAFLPLRVRFRATAFFFFAPAFFFGVLAFRSGALARLLTRDACAAASSVNCVAFETMMPAVVPTVRAMVFRRLSSFAAG